MTATLEQTIRDLAARGEISDLSLSMNASHTKWRAVLVPCSQFSMSVAEDVDPVKALMMAMNVKLASKKPRNPRVRGIQQETIVVENTTSAEVECSPDADIDALM
jgi:hypothetical protein